MTIGPTYRYVTRGVQATTIECLLCGSSSPLRGDIENRYCGRCHLFHDAVAAARRQVAFGATHECHEWPTAAGACAVCGAALEALS